MLVRRGKSKHMYRGVDVKLWRSNQLRLLAFLFAICVASDALAQSADVASKFPKLQFRKWSGDLNVPDPVAVSVDNQGRVYASQTRRRKIQDLDIRQHKEWIPNDLSMRSVDDKRKFFKGVLAIDGDQDVQASHVKDWNKDGNFDWRDLTVVSEAIYRLVDSDNDGTADEITTFAEKFDSEVTGVAAGVMAYDGEVYATVAPDVWKLRDQNEDGVSESRDVLATGFGLHIAYGGHDMHGLTVGPDGKIYWSIGDKGIHVTSKEGKVFHYPHEGGVMRCNPDGSDFEVFAHGLRNVQEVAFDQYGNMFGVDNDSDRPGEKERFVYIVNQMDAGWRCYYQYRKDEYNPWTDEKLWELPGENHPAYIVPPIQHYVDGPAGFKFNPGTALSPKYKDFFFLTGAPEGKQFAFRTERDGDSFRMKDAHKIGEGVAIVGLAFGPDGGLYGADWDGGYPLDEKGSVIRIDVSQDERHPARDATQEILSGGLSGETAKRLLTLLSHEDMRVRQMAQFELVKQEKAGQLAAVAGDNSQVVVARLHALWGLGQLARQGDVLARDTISLQLADDNLWVRGQAAKTFGELSKVASAPLVKLLDDKEAYVRTLAGLALARHPTEKAVKPLLEQADKLEKSSHYLRHSIATALGACATSEQLVAEATAKSEMRRMCCVLALRHQASPTVAAYLQDPSEWIATEAARAIHDGDGIADARTKLSLALNQRENSSEAFFLRSLNACFLLGNSEAIQQLLTFLSADHATEQKIQVLEAIKAWENPSPLDRVEGSYRHQLASTQRDEFPVAKLESVVEGLAASSESKLRESALRVASTYSIELSMDSLKAIVLDENADEGIRLQALSQIDSQIEDLFATIDKSESTALRLRALELRTESNDSDALLQQMQAILIGDGTAEAKQKVIETLVASDNAESLDLLEQLGKQLADGTLDKRLALDVYAGLQGNVERRSSFSEILKQIDDAVEEQTPKAKFRFSATGGNVARGKKLFTTHQQAQCARCHRIGQSGSEIGPELTKISTKRKAKHLLQSIIEPSAEIEPKYQSQILLLDSDEVMKGVIQSQEDGVTVVADSEGKLREIRTDEIVATNKQKVSLMPDMSEILSPAEVRDLVAYLESLK